MSDGQTQACEANAPPVSIRLERGESVKWHDGTQWHVGTVLANRQKWVRVISEDGEWYIPVQTCDGIYCVSYDVLQPYGPRCTRCGGDQIIKTCINGFTWTEEPCPDCKGSGRKQ